MKKILLLISGLLLMIVRVDAQCPPKTIPFFEGFETGNSQSIDIANCWIQETVYGLSWKANTDRTTFNRTPRTGSWNALLSSAQSSSVWMFQSVSLVGGTSYTFDIYARQDKNNNEASIKVSYGTEANSASMTNQIVPRTYLVWGDYQLLTGTFTPAETGDYVIGVLGTIGINATYISIDDISIYENPQIAEPDWVNLQSPDNATIIEGSEATIYAQAYKEGLTDNVGQGAGITCWIGYSTVNTDPKYWTNWIPATYNRDVGNNDEYKANINLISGTYYYASRFKFPDGAYGYGGFSNDGGGFWNGTTNVSGVLIINAFTVTTFPYVQDFESNLTGWRQFDMDGYTPSWSTVTGINHTSGGTRAVYHSYGNEDYPQNGSLVSPEVFLPNRGSCLLTFWSYNYYPNDYAKNSVLISTGSGNPTDGEFTEIWTTNSVLQSWVQTSIDLSSFAGKSIYIAFKYEGTWAHSWYADDVVISYSPPIEWTGANSNDWHNAQNWNGEQVPSSAEDVIIPAGLSNYPTISSAASCKTITLQSNAGGTASLLGNEFLTVTGDAIVEHEITGDSYDWHLLSSPIAAQAIEGDFIPTESGYDFYAWDEPTVTWLNQKVEANNLETFTPGQGYLVAYEAPNTKTFAGLLNNGVITQRLSVASSGFYQHSNLLGNPYPSFIDWTISTGFDQSKLVEDGDGYNIYIWDNDEAGNYGVYNSATGDYWGTNGASRYIPPMQGFFVIAETGGGEFIFNNEARVHEPQSSKKPGSGNSFRLSVTAPANAGKDEILLDFGHEASKGGADKWFSMSATAPSLYAATAERDYSIRFLTSIDDNPLIPVAFKAGLDGEYSIQANFSQTAFSVKLMDQFTGNVQDLNKNPFYSFTATTGDDANRFNLVFGTLGIDNPESAEAIQVYAYGDVLYLATSSKEAALVNVYNLTGQLVMQSKTNGSDLTTFNASALSNGVYVVNVIFNQGVVSQKVVIRK